jgi:DNA-3-methyladenine glycosylase II
MRKAVAHLKKNDPVLRSIIERVGSYRLQKIEPTFESLVRSIVFQQLSGKVARVIFARLAEAAPGGAITPATILELPPERMRLAGLSSRKAAYIRDLAVKTLEGSIQFEALPAMNDADVIARLTQVKGIGVWTAHMFLIFALCRTDVLPVGDLGIRTAVRNAYGFEELPGAAELERLALNWRPYCSVASWYLWRMLDGQAGL